MQDTQLPLTQAIQRALAACQRSDWAEAQRICDAILAAQPGQFDALNLLGMIAVHNRRLDEAVELLERALATNPRSAQAHAMRASALLELGRPAQALENLDRAIEISPQSAEIHNHRGLALHRLGRTVEAVESYGRAIAANPFAISRGPVASTDCIDTPSVWAATWTFLSPRTLAAFEGFTNTATRLRFGSKSRSICKRACPTGRARPRTRR